MVLSAPSEARDNERPRQLAGWPWWVRGLIVAVTNLLIASFLTAIGFGGDFRVNLIVSECIGMTIWLSLELTLFALGERRPWVAMAAVVVGSLIGTVLGGIATGNSLLFPEWRPTIYWQSVLIGLVFGGAVASFFLFRHKLHEMRYALQSERVRAAEAQRAEAEAELRLLRAQVEPHFLFNTLAHVASLIETNPGQARGLLDRLIEYLRSALRHSRQERATLSQEMAIVGAYLDLMRERMPDRLRYYLDVADEIRQVSVPPMILQPLVENAIKHGLEPQVGGGTITIAGWCDDQQRVIEVRDDGRGLGETADGPGNGLTNLRERLRALYGEHAKVSVEQTANAGTVARLSLPAGTEL